MANKLDVESILLFEQPFAKVPYENYRKVFRTSAKHIEREFSAVQHTSKDISSRFKSGSVPSEDLVSSIDNMIGRMQTLKRKLSDLHDNAGKPTQDVMRERLQHLGLLENVQGVDTPEYTRWADTRLDRWLVDWCLRNGKEETAKQIARERDIEILVDLDLFSDIRRIETALERHSCAEALGWCSENKAALRKTKNTLEFELRLQEYIELCRTEKRQEAIAYMKKHIVPWHTTHLSQIKQASGLLAFSPRTSCGPYKRLYDPSRWVNLVKSFHQTIYLLNTLPTEPLLNLSLYAGLVSLKLPACFDPLTKNADCPVCDKEASASGQAMGLGKLATEVPYSQRSNSILVCGISGKIMDADNMPMVFPDGSVYSREALEEMAAKNSGFVTCPRTGTVCEYSKLKKVYIS
ncbi:hypothetical protein K435DRAFT_757373 [Dendrothele bispora CBS 962.96]|uniref:Macrophage erythroblast attacher n=1 Tax=Dendrothele bispora (strain CBS 962.96) TaxID=1314807 RepID=A0A4S8LV78_DENBC|nr:hypothetical protein K435DRAFT_757373 [Dendrothele bispora CBS 962.96]